MASVDTTIFVLSTDANVTAIGYILDQVNETVREQAIAFGGRALHPNEKNGQFLSCLAVISGMEAYKHYLKSNRLKVFTNHKALHWLNNINDHTSRLGRWILHMKEFDFEIIHREGKKNQNADAISWFPYVDEQTPSPSPALVSALDVGISFW